MFLDESLGILFDHWRQTLADFAFAQGLQQSWQLLRDSRSSFGKQVHHYALENQANEYPYRSCYILRCGVKVLVNGVTRITGIPRALDPGTQRADHLAQVLADVDSQESDAEPIQNPYACVKSYLGSDRGSRRRSHPEAEKADRCSCARSDQCRRRDNRHHHEQALQEPLEHSFQRLARLFF